MKTTNPSKLVVISDVQYPYQDEDTICNLLEWLGDFKPDHVVFNGDILDATSIGKYTLDPGKVSTFKEDVAGCREWITTVEKQILRANPYTRLYWNDGNHEDRVRRYLWNKAPEFGELPDLTIPALLGLDSKQWQYTPYYNPVQSHGRVGTGIQGLLFIHGWTVRKWSAMTARAAWEQFGGSGVISHTHRLGQFYHRNYWHTEMWLESGCLCSLDPFYTVLPDWQQGFVAGYLFPEDKDEQGVSRFDLRCVPVIKHRFVWEGRYYK